MKKKIDQQDMEARSKAFYQFMRKRRSVRDFSDQPVSKKVIENCIRTAATAPSGANQQPWHFAVVENQDLKHQIRLKSESIEQEFYKQLAPKAWLKALKPIGTNIRKPFLDNAPVLIAIFVQKYSLSSKGEKIKHYYPHESVCIATGLLITAIHHAGLGCLTYTPIKMNFLNGLLNRPKNERPLMILAVGYPDFNAEIPNLSIKSFEEITSFI
jgi:iodotyrosine deiodinase